MPLIPTLGVVFVTDQDKSRASHLAKRRTNLSFTPGVLETCCINYLHRCSADCIDHVSGLKLASCTSNFRMIPDSYCNPMLSWSHDTDFELVPMSRHGHKIWMLEVGGRESRGVAEFRVGSTREVSRLVDEAQPQASCHNSPKSCVQPSRPLRRVFPPFWSAEGRPLSGASNAETPSPHFYWYLW